MLVYSGSVAAQEVGELVAEQGNRKRRRGKLKKIIVIMILASCSVSWVAADTITSLVGDKDGFGIDGMAPVPANGTVIFGQSLVQEVEDPAFMDMWGFEQIGGAFGSPITYLHEFASLPGPVISAYLIVQHAGMGDQRGPWDVAVNGTSVGQIGPVNDGTSSKVELFFSPTMIGLSNEITLTYLDALDEGFAINYSELVVEAIPEPASAAMIALMAGCGAFIRRQFIR